MVNAQCTQFTHLSDIQTKMKKNNVQYGRIYARELCEVCEEREERERRI